MKGKYKFVIDGTGVQFPDIQRQNVESGVSSQKTKMLDFWHSKVPSGFVCVFERLEDSTFHRFPNRVFEIFRTGEEKEIPVEEWMERRLKIPRKKEAD